MSNHLAIKCSSSPSSSSVVDGGGDSVAALERCFLAPPAPVGDIKGEFGPVMKGGKFGVFGAITLEKGKLDLSREQVASSPEVADDTVYGVCLHVSEIVQRRPCILGASLPLSHSLGRFSHFLVFAPRCYCVLTSVPFFELHYEMTTGGRKVLLCGLIQYLNLFGVAIGYTTAASVAIKRSNCFHKSGGKNPCHMSSNGYMITFGIVEVLFSQIPNFDQVWWLSIVAAKGLFM